MSNFLYFRKTPIDWGEGLPVVTPSYFKVKKMLGDDWKLRNEIYKYIESIGVSFSYYQLASNAVLAGCSPRAWKTYKTCIDVLLDKKFNIETVVTTVHSQSPLFLISGNQARELNITGGRGSIGPGLGESISIGRAVYLFLRNVCNAKPDILDSSTLGHLGKVSFCFAENIDLSPWKEFHIRNGIDGEQSTVTVFSSQSPHEIVDMGTKSIDTLLDALRHTLLNPWTYNAFYNQDVWILMSPEHAQRFSASGMNPDDIKNLLFEECIFEKSDLENRGLHGFIDKNLDNEVKLFKSPENIKILVTGGSPGGYSMVCFGSGISITKEIK